MSGHPRPEPEHDSAATLIATPKSSVWQGFLGAAWVLSSSLLLEVVAKLLEGSVGQSRVLSSLAGVLRWVAVAVVAAAALYVLWRKTMDMREGVRIGHELDLTADLVQPPPAVARTVRAVSASVPATTQPLTTADRAVDAVLCELPFDDYEAAALYDVVTAMLDSATLLPGEQPVARPSAGDVLIRLAAHGRVVHHDHDRFRIARSAAPAPGRSVVRRSPQWRAALPALVHHYADRAARWSVALDSERLGAGAHRWFTGSAGRLGALLRACAEQDHGIALDIAALAQIADALDLWNARIGRPADNDAARAMLELVPASHPEVRELALIRCGRPPEAPAGRRWPRRLRLRRRERRRRNTGLTARRAHAAALGRLEQWRPDVTTPPAPDTDHDATRRWWRSGWSALTGSGAPGGLAPESAIVDGFERAWWLLPRRDVAGEVGALIDLAITHLYQGRLEAARDRLELAETLTRGGRNPSGRAHTFEILGVLWWMRGEPRRAMRWWQLALTRYRDLGHELGICRCLQHLGSAVTVAPEYGGLVLSGPLDTGEVLRQAAGWLAYAARNRPDSAEFGMGLAALYRDRVIHALTGHDAVTHRLAPTTVDRWPATVPDA